MRLLLADENFPIPSVRELRAEGYDVYAVAESDSSITDEQVIEKAITEERIILTFDKDFGELIFKKAIVRLLVSFSFAGCIMLRMS